MKQRKESCTLVLPSILFCCSVNKSGGLCSKNATSSVKRCGADSHCPSSVSSCSQRAPCQHRPSLLVGPGLYRAEAIQSKELRSAGSGVGSHEVPQSWWRPICQAHQHLPEKGNLWPFLLWSRVAGSKPSAQWQRLTDVQLRPPAASVLDSSSSNIQAAKPTFT